LFITRSNAASVAVELSSPASISLSTSLRNRSLWSSAARHPSSAV